MYGQEQTHLFPKFLMSECGVYLQYKKQSSKDPRMPKDLQERCARYLEWMGWSSPTASPNGSNIEGKEDDEERKDIDNVVAGLLGLSSTTDIGIEFEYRV